MQVGDCFKKLSTTTHKLGDDVRSIFENNLPFITEKMSRLVDLCVNSGKDANKYVFLLVSYMKLHCTVLKEFISVCLIEELSQSITKNLCCGRDITTNYKNFEATFVFSLVVVLFYLLKKNVGQQCMYL